MSIIKYIFFLNERLARFTLYFKLIKGRKKTLKIKNGIFNWHEK